MNDVQLLEAITKLFEKQDEKLDERLSRQDSKLDKLQIHQEAVIMPRLELLYEGHNGLADQIKRVAQPENI